tara:strand:+ start:2606 stop:2818 length:213 start_codon:yes stop_codon:yes gene_type:complete
MSYDDSTLQRNSSGVVINTSADKQISARIKEKEREKSLSEALSSIQENQKFLMEQILELKASFEIIMKRI